MIARVVYQRVQCPPRHREGDFFTLERLLLLLMAEKSTAGLDPPVCELYP